MKEIGRTSERISYEGNGRFANMVKVNSFRDYFKVITRDEEGNIKTIATRCTQDEAYKLIKDYLK